MNDGVINVKGFDANGDGITDDTASIQMAVDAALAIGGGVVLCPAGTYRLSSNITFPSDVTLWFVNGAKFSIDSTVTVTINGPVTAGAYPIFSGSGTVAGNMKVDVVYPQWWGAKGDGINDDRLSLQNAFKCACTNNLTVDLLNHYTYMINSSNGSSIFDLNGPVHIVGRSTIKIGSIGDYEMLFNLKSDNISFEDFTIDDHTAGNPMTSQTGTIGKRRVSIYGFNAGVIQNIQFKRIRIKDTLGVWQITMKAKHVIIEDCIIEYASTGSPTYDRTCCYMNGENWSVRNNRFIGSPISHTCMETHGSEITVDGNFVKDFDAPLYIVNDNNAVPSIESVSIANNTFISRQGIRLWFEISNCNVNTVNIHNNSITVTGDHYGILTHYIAGANVVVDRVHITSNHFKLNAQNYAFIELYNTQGGAGYTGSVVYNRVFINDNSFTGTVKEAVKLYSQPIKHQSFKYVEFKGNTFDIAQLYTDRLIYMVDTPVAFEDVQFNDNVFNVRSVASPYTLIRMFQVGYVEANRPAIHGNVKLKNKSYSIPSGIAFNYSNTQGNLVLESNERLDHNLQTAAALYIYKGILTDIYNQSITYDQGAVAKQIRNGSAPPTSGTYNAGDYVNNVTPAAGGYMGWVCVAAGAPGTWKGFGAIQV
ncbi:hypothetical protein D7M11_33545 [Paenibacillus ginsengarvi]|uniref:Rhamnogalacturonase A/B/Epimerase-like pectate lyase domain-containing protein n=2 Tax=Paenibacillus ginsengarvi TaxID=400777 RepID=A0A3B0AWR1_9BACL|nr:hypothetical protein D7M11_33545 [Paenibacillus ginsengarvi]